MILTGRVVRGVGAACALMAGLAVVAAVPASAASGGWADDHFSMCSGSCTKGAAKGTIVWGNRTANVSGSVTDTPSDLATTVIFDAYAGNTLVDHQTRTASATTRSYRFPIGDPDLPGGVNRILIKVCTATLGGTDLCNGPFEERRD